MQYYRNINNEIVCTSIFIGTPVCISCNLNFNTIKLTDKFLEIILNNILKHTCKPRGIRCTVVLPTLNDGPERTNHTKAMNV